MSDFKKAIEKIITVHEGGFQNRKDDPGNWRNGVLVGTNFGISARSFPSVDIVNLTRDQADEIYQQYWGMFALLNDDTVLTKVLDLAVNMQFAGHGPATVILQTAVNAVNMASVQQVMNEPVNLEPLVPFFPLAIDGDFGQHTADAANVIDPEKFLPVICSTALAHYKEIEARQPGMVKWFRNWEQRAVWMPQPTAITMTE